MESTPKDRETQVDPVDVVERFFRPDRVRETAIQMGRTPTPQTELYDREPKILKAIREFYRPKFEDAGCSTYIDDYGNLIATQGTATATGRKILFLGYAMDWAEATMPNPWSGEPMDGTQFGVDGEVVWGRGGAEWHPTNVAMIECAKIVAESRVPLTGQLIYVISSGGHTSSSDPVYHLLHNDQLHADLCLTPGTKEIVLGNCGRLDLRVNVYGRSVHSGGELAAGSNAIEGGLEALERLGKIIPYSPDRPRDPDMGQGRLSVIGLASYPFSPGFHNGVGSGGHTLQNCMRFLLDRRLIPGESVEAAIDEIRAAIGDLSPWRITFERGALQYPSKHAVDSELIHSLTRSYQRTLKESPTFRYVDYTIDAGFMNMSGIPTAMFGAIDLANCHGDIEFLNLNDTCDITKVYTVWALDHVS